MAGIRSSPPSRQRQDSKPMSASHQFENVALIFQWHTSRNDSELWAMEIAREKGVRSCCRRCSSVTEK